ncbi:MAG: OmpH family outer membrane protein [Lentisphaeria bacterium]|nr:OmpH family outer membrane protein [Lentisphaeria bacterium]
MGSVLKKLLPVLALCAFFTVQGADRIGTVDLEKVFREYHKSRAVEEFINRRADAVRAYMNQLREQLKKLNTEMHRLGTEASNPALSTVELDKARRAALEAEQKVKAKTAEIQLYSTQVAKEIRELENKKRQEIMADINAEIRRRANVRGFDFILDKSGKTLNAQPTVLYSPADRDITAEVIRELNRTAAKPKQEKKK